MLATLVFGLSPDSRVKMAISGQKLPTDLILLAGILDWLSLLVWMNTKDASKGKNKPKSLVEEITKPEKKDDLVKFNSVAEFEAARAKLLQDLEKEV